MIDTGLRLLSVVEMASLLFVMSLLRPGLGLPFVALDVNHLFKAQARFVSAPAFPISVMRCAPVFTRALKASDQAQALETRQRTRKRNDTFGDSLLRDPARMDVSSMFSAAIARNSEDCSK